MHLFDMPLFAAQLAHETQFMRLEQLLRCKSRGVLDHPWHQLAAPTRGLAHAMLQSLATQAQLSEDLWLEGVVDGQLDAVADHLFQPRHLAALQGFALFGDTAFLQMPKDVFPQGSGGESVEGLFQPFRARRTGTAKALRSGSEFSGVCPGCAAIGLHCLHAFSGSMARYWGAAPTRGAVVYHLESGSIGQSLLLNVLHAGSLPRSGSEKTLCKSLPWVPDQGGQAGRDTDGRLPFEKHLNATQQIAHPAQGVHPFIRSCRLIEPAPADLGRCDACGRTAQPMVRRFMLQSENEVLKALAPQTMAALKKAGNGEPVMASGVIARSLSKKFIHPALARVQFNPKNTDGAEKNPVRIQQVSGGTEGLSSTSPTWLHLAEALSSGVASMPPVLQQYLASSEVQQALNRDIKLGLFGVQFMGALNPNPKFVLDAIHGASLYLHSQATASEVAQAADGMASWVKKLLDGWVAGAEKLEWSVTRSADGLKLKMPESSSRRKYARTAALNDPILQTLSARLWSEALQEVTKIISAIVAQKEPGEIEQMRELAREQLRTQASRFWDSFLRRKAAPAASMEEYFLETSANDAFYRFIAPKSVQKSALKPLKKLA